jgi:hypothetical protein
MAGHYPRYREVDTHEMLKHIAISERSAACREHFPKSRPCEQAPHGVSDQYLVLDSALCEVPSPSVGMYQFNISSQKAAGKRTVGVRDKLKTITEIQSFAFCMPLPLLPELSGVEVAALPLTLTPNPGVTDPRDEIDPVNSLRSQLAHCSRVTLYITEAGEQCYHGFKGSKHHFEYVATVEGTIGQPGARLLLTPINELYIFTNPLTDLHGITMQFYGPDTRIRFPPDEFRNVLLSTNVASQITVTVTSTDGSAVDLSTILTPGDRIFFDDVKVGTKVTTNGNTQENLSRELNAYLMREDGLFVGTIPTATTLLTDPAIVSREYGAEESLPLLSSITMRIAKNRMRAPFRCRRIVDGLTNYIDPT